MELDIRTLAETVQHNCHIADARHAGDYTLCVYLLKMREMYRWEQGESFKTALTTDDVGDWLTEREGAWDDVEEQDYKSLDIDGKSYDPFDNDAINVLLESKGLVYNAGLGIRCRPHFFLGQLEEEQQADSHTILISGKEYARDMAAPPAMIQGDKVFVRMESLRRVLWEKFEEWRMTGLDNPIGRAASFYNFETDVEAALDEISDVESRMVIAHEVGEIMAGQEYGDAWLAMLNAIPRSHAEIMLRAVRDHYADALHTLPLLVENANPASIHFYFGNLTAMRKKLAPALYSAYETWHKTDDLQALEQLIPAMAEHWQRTGKEALGLYQKSGDQAVEDIEALVLENILS
ncbi:MAG: Unknown protein [uncultured Thiotrichaceae bacterium]|uniref:Uncharacterized protein n=1 Tax=uncultured Thiotrichaceae bacterium TaxID=298394 RepID=A0A6S6TUH4_9GAMM|nr:MAG: Unknown protein [uncultured Thiotrichaceae bacterium]